MNRLEIIAHLERAGLPVFDMVIDFQQRLGGLEYSVCGLENHSICFNLLQQVGNSFEVEGFAAANDEEGFSMSNDDRFFFVCAVSRSIPFTFYLDQAGSMYVHDGTTNRPLPVATSPDKYIESDAVLDELLSLRPVWHRAGLGFVASDDARVNERLALMPLSIISEASDAYTTWWIGDTVRIWRRMHWNIQHPCSVIIASAQTQDELEYWRRTLQDLVGEAELMTH